MEIWPKFNKKHETEDEVKHATDKESRTQDYATCIYTNSINVETERDSDKKGTSSKSKGHSRVTEIEESIRQTSTTCKNKGRRS